MSWHHSRRSEGFKTCQQLRVLIWVCCTAKWCCSPKLGQTISMLRKAAFVSSMQLPVFKGAFVKANLRDAELEGGRWPGHGRAPQA